MSEPNLYEVSGDQAEITYLTTSMAGRAQFHYKDQHHDVSASGDDIRINESELGTEVTITLTVMALNNTKVTLLIPQVTLPDHQDHTPVKTLAILTTDRTEAIPPVRQSYSVRHLQGRARMVKF